MSKSGTVEVKVPDLGEFKDVAVIDVLVKAGDTVAVETPLITLETEKATLDVPSPAAGVVEEVTVRAGDRVNTGSLIARLRAAGSAAKPGADESSRKDETAPHHALRESEPYGGEPYMDTVPIEPMEAERKSRALPREATTEPTAAPREGQAPAAAPAPAGSAAAPAAVPATPTGAYDFDLVVLGAGPGGYTAAFRAADLGLKVSLIERWPQLGGVCLNVGCIPSKALLHAARVIEEANEMSAHGIAFGKPTIDVVRLREWKSRVVNRLAGGLANLARQRKVTVIQGTAQLTAPHELRVTGRGEARTISFAQCIIAAGSEPTRLPGLPDDPRIIDSTGALDLDLPESLLVIGGGIIGLEMATVYQALGVKVSVVELTDGLMPGCDRDLVKPLEKRIAARYENVWTGTRVTAVEARAEGLRVAFAGARAPEAATYDRGLVSVGRSPNGARVGAEAAGVKCDERGFIPVDRQQRTSQPHIFAIGDIVGQPMLAHKASHEGKVAAEVAAGLKSSFDARVIPSVAYTDPEIAWVGLTETEARASGTEFEKGSFPWAASARSLTLGRDEGLTKLLFDPATHRLLGGGIVGPNAGDLIAEVALAIEMGADAADIALTVHPHPTLSETVAMSAEAFDGTLTDLYLPRRKPRLAPTGS
jgi:dihydrolipoamide dehydrogenase